MLRKKGFLYRIISITLAFLVFGVAVFVPILAGSSGDNLPGIIALIVYGGVYLLTLIGNEVYIFIHNRKERK